MLVSCAAYQDGKKLADIEVGRIPEYLERPRGFVWVALRDATAAELEEMRVQFHLHPLALEDAQAGHERPKLEEYGSSLFAVLHLIEPEGSEYRVGELAVFVGSNYVLSVRNRAQKGFQEVRARSEREPELLKQGPGYILYALMDAVVDRYFPILDKVEDELDVIEARIFTPAGAPRANIEGLYALKQRLTVIKHAVAPLLESVSNLSGARVPVLCAGTTLYFRDVYDHLQRLNQTADSIRDTIGTAMSVNLSMVSLQENETMKRLAAYAALLAVPTMIAGIYGMNFEHMPELKWRYGYLASLAVMIAIDVLLYFRFKRSGWL
ncbi:MAG TPA: magnesium/cobalt transporter CorA [Steroidobacteraceae bacterium]|jgi:magnesium transporter|nr:magnesium/cobalt transporter CorA [Steroidobacteraceae bacterium]